MAAEQTAIHSQTTNDRPPAATKQCDGKATYRDSQPCDGHVIQEHVQIFRLLKVAEQIPRGLKVISSILHPLGPDSSPLTRRIFPDPF